MAIDLLLDDMGRIFSDSVSVNLVFIMMIVLVRQRIYVLKIKGVAKNEHRFLKV